MELIDMKTRTPARTRSWGNDVVPFIPVDGVTIEISWRWRSRVGKRNLETLSHPIFFYEGQRPRPDRVNLENVRRGQYEGLPRRLKKHDRQPDVGDRSCIPTQKELTGGRRAGNFWWHINVNLKSV